MKLLSDATEYGLRAVVWLAQRPEQAQKAREIAEGTHSAPGYLVKVLQALAKAGILSAQRGSHGGFTLERDPGSLSALEVINAIDPIERIRTCPLGLEAHGDCLCPMHRRIDDAMAAIEATFSSITITELLNEASRGDLGCNFLTQPCLTPPTASTSASVSAKIPAPRRDSRPGDAPPPQSSVPSTPV